MFLDEEVAKSEQPGYREHEQRYDYGTAERQTPLTWVGHQEQRG